MNTQFYKSWKFAFTVAAGMSILVTGYKLTVGPDIATQILENRTSAAFPKGQPSPELRGKVIAEGTSLLTLNFTLAEFENYLRSNSNEIFWEPENERSFVMRTTRFDPLTKVQNEFAYQMKVLQPSELPVGEPTFADGAITVTAMAFNAEMVDQRVAQNVLFQMQTDIELRRQSAVQ